MLKTAPHKKAARLFLEYLASDSAQTYFADGNNEWPAVTTTRMNNPALATLASSRRIPSPFSMLARNAGVAQRVFDRAGWK